MNDTRKIFLIFLVADLLLLSANCGNNQLVAQTLSYQIQTLGFTDSDHTRDDGYMRSQLERSQFDSGVLFGKSERFNGSADFGDTAWKHDGNSTINIGLIDAEHTRNDGYRDSLFLANNSFNRSGQAIGFSRRYSGGDYHGGSAWIHDGNSTIKLGLTGNEYTRADGYKESVARFLNDSGQVAGTANRYSGSDLLAFEVWKYDGSNHQVYGLYDADHTRFNGLQSSSAIALTDSGEVYGTSTRYIGAIGRSYWKSDGANTVRVGLFGDEHTGDDGRQDHTLAYVSETDDFAAGYSQRYSGSTDLGRSAWRIEGTETIQIGFTDTEHTRSDGYRSSRPTAISSSGTIYGVSNSYNDDDLQGSTAWKIDENGTSKLGLLNSEHTSVDGIQSNVVTHTYGNGAVGSSTRYLDSGFAGSTRWKQGESGTQIIGLTGAEHTRDDGYRWSGVHKVNESGDVLGTSERFDGSTSLGSSAWVHRGNQTIEIGLTDSIHTRADGFQEHFISLLNKAGDVAGSSTRYDGTSWHGSTAWYLDSESESIFELVFSERSDGYARSQVSYLGEDGTLFGVYELYDSADDSLGFQGFLYSPEAGMHNLGSLVDGGLANSDWQLLSGVIQTNGIGQITGHGQLSSDSIGQMAFLLTPISAVPEPSSVILFGALATGLFVRRRR